MNYDFIEIGTSDFETLIQSSTDEIGLSIDAVNLYLNRLPNKEKVTKLNHAISNYSGVTQVYYVEPEDIESYNLSWYLKGCNSIGEPHPVTLRELKEHNLEHLLKVDDVEVLTWKDLVERYSIESVKTLKIDPRIFIEKPYVQCPKCKKKDSFGTLMINETCFTKRCRECWYSQTYKLPPLDKKVIYLDQFVISNMMKSINDKIGKKQKVEKVYLKLFEKLDRLVKLQIIVCPDSSFHRDESLLSFYSAIKRMYEQLSHGVSFYDTSTIRRFQICEDFKHYLEDENKDYKTNIDVNSVTMGNLCGWQSKMLISVDVPIKQEDDSKAG